MNTRKSTMILLFMLFFPILTLAEELSQSAIAFRSSIKAFLKEEGFSPTIDNEGGIIFKKEGCSYYINVYDNKPFYVVFQCEPFSDEGVQKEYLMLALNDANLQTRSVKFCYYNNVITCRIESYCYLAEDFKYVFYNYLNLLEYSGEVLRNAYYQYSSTGPSESSNSTEIPIHSSVLETSYHSWWITSIELKSTGTIVHNSVLPKTNSTYIYSTENEFIEDCDTGKKYYIQASSIAMAPRMTILNSKDRYNFISIFPTLPSSVKRINIWSGQDYYVKNLVIRKSQLLNH